MYEFALYPFRRQIVEENRYMDEKENIRQRSAERYIIMCMYSYFESCAYIALVAPSAIICQMTCVLWYT